MADEIITPEAPTATGPTVIGGEPTKDQAKSERMMGNKLAENPHTTPDEIQRIHDALEKAMGRMPYAAVLLGMKQETLKDKIYNIDELKNRWSTKHAGRIPNEAQVMNRKPPRLKDQDKYGKLPQVVPVDEMQVARAMEQEQNIFRDGLSHAGLSNRHVEFALNAQRIAHSSFRSALEAVHGTVVTNAFSLGIEKQDVQKRLDDIREKLNDLTQYPLGSENRGYLLAEEKSLAQQARELDGQITSHKKVTDDGVLTLSLVRKAKEKKQKPNTFKPANVVNI